MAVQITNSFPPTISLDLSHLRQISEGDLDFEYEILTIYIEEVPSLMKKTKWALKQRNHELAANLIHELRSKIQIIGLKKAWRLARIIEENLRSHTTISKLSRNLQVLFKMVRLSLHLVNRELLKSPK